MWIRSEIIWASTNVELHDGYLHYYRDPEIAYQENQKQADDYFHWLQAGKGHWLRCDGHRTGMQFLGGKAMDL